MKISEQSIEAVRQAADIVEVASEFTALKREGTDYRGLCPYHMGKSTSFSASREKNFFHCFRCEAGGDAIKLVMELKSLSFTDAVAHLGERFGVKVKYEGHSPEEERAAEERITARRLSYKALAAATTYYHKYLVKSPRAKEARHYLHKRGLETPTIEEFRIGYAPARGESGFIQAAGRVGLEQKALEDAGLLTSRGTERFHGRVTFPISDQRGRISGLGARTLGEEQPKYLNSPETSIFSKRSLLYGLPQAAQALRKERAALVVEGYMDVLMLYQAGIHNVVGTLGIALSDEHLKLLSGYVDTICLIFDPDVAGEQAIERAAIQASEMQLDLRVLRLSEDPADWIGKHSTGEFKELLVSAMSILEYTLKRKAGQARGAPAAKRSRMVGEIKALIKKIEDPVFKQEAIRLAAEALAVEPEALYEQPSVREDASRRRQPSNPLTEASREVLALMLALPDLAPRDLGAKDFNDEAHASIFALLVEHRGQDTRGVFADERARPHLSELAGLQVLGERLYPSPASFDAACLRLRLLNCLRNKQALKNREDMDDASWARLHLQLHQEARALRAALAEIEPEVR